MITSGLPGLPRVTQISSELIRIADRSRRITTGLPGLDWITSDYREITTAFNWITGDYKCITKDNKTIS